VTTKAATTPARINVVPVRKGAPVTSTPVAEGSMRVVEADVVTGVVSVVRVGARIGSS
jgi:hypothetical protein